MKKISALNGKTDGERKTDNKNTGNQTGNQIKLGLGGKIREIADRLQQETVVQKKATVRILAAAAQISHNHEQLIDEVVEMVEEDLERQVNITPIEVYTVEIVKQKYKTLRAAKEQLNMKVNSWQALVKQLNNLVVDANSRNHLLTGKSSDKNQVNNQSQYLADTHTGSHTKYADSQQTTDGDRNHFHTGLSVNLDPDVAEVFPNDQAVNEALRFLIRVTNKHIR